MRDTTIGHPLGTDHPNLVVLAALSSYVLTSERQRVCR
jgi:hypothetical protein